MHVALGVEFGLDDRGRVGEGVGPGVAPINPASAASTRTALLAAPMYARRASVMTPPSTTTRTAAPITA